MKKLFILLITIVLSSNNYVVSQTSLKGTISNFSEAKLIKLKYSLNGYFLKEQEETINLLGKNGSFVFNLPIQKAGLAILILEKKDGTRNVLQVYLKPNTSLEILADFNDAERFLTSVIFKGDLEKENAFFQKNELAYSNPNPEDTIPAIVLKNIQQKKKEALKNLIESNQKLNFDKDFFEFAKMNIGYYYDSKFIDTASLHKMYQDAQMNKIFDTYEWGKIAKEKLLSIFQDKKEKKFSIEWYGYLHSPYHNVMWAYFYDIKVTEKTSKAYNDFYLQCGDKINEVYKDQALEINSANFVYQLAYQKQFNEHDAILKLYQKFKQQFPKSEFLPLIDNVIIEVKKHQEATKKSLPKDIQLIEKANEITKLDDLLIKFKGKTVLVDLWGTWCSACKKEFKYAKDLKTYFKDKNLTYLYIADENDASDKEESWLTYIKVNQLTGYHLIANKELLEDIENQIKTISNEEIKKLTGTEKEYAVEKKKGKMFYPSYLIVNPKGEIIFKSAYSPSTKELLYKQIEQVLSE